MKLRIALYVYWPTLILELYFRNLFTLRRRSFHEHLVALSHIQQNKISLLKKWNLLFYSISHYLVQEYFLLNK